MNESIVDCTLNLKIKILAFNFPTGIGGYVYN